MTLLGGTCVADCKVLAKHAREIGLYGISFTAPFYFKPADVQTLGDICAEIAAEVPDMPFYYYHIPVLTGVAFNMIDLLSAIDGKRSEEHTSELQSRPHLVCRLLLEKKKKNIIKINIRPNIN